MDLELNSLSWFQQEHLSPAAKWACPSTGAQGVLKSGLSTSQRRSPAMLKAFVQVGAKLRHTWTSAWLLEELASSAASW